MENKEFTLNKGTTTYKDEFLDHFSQITDKLNYFAKRGKTDFNVDLEEWLIPIISEYLDSDFIKEKNINAAAIDLANVSRTIGVQITGLPRNSGQ